MSKMKLIGTYTARGVCSETETTSGDPQRIFLHDGSNKTGYRVIDFKIWSSQVDTTAASGCVGKLSKNDIGVTSSENFFRADDDNQIAWAVSGHAADAGTAGQFDEAIIDPENLVIDDMFVYVRSSSTPSDPINYLVTMEKYEIDGWRGTLEMARDQFDGE